MSRFCFPSVFCCVRAHHWAALHVTTSLLHHIFGVKLQNWHGKQGETLSLLLPLYGRSRWALHSPLLLLGLQKASDEWGDASETTRGETKHQPSCFPQICSGLISPSFVLSLFFKSAPFTFCTLSCKLSLLYSVAFSQGCFINFTVKWKASGHPSARERLEQQA